LAGWSDYDLEAVGRLAEPLSYNPASDKYEPISWEDAFALVGERCEASLARTERRFTLRGGSATRPPSSISCGSASSARTTSRIALICATRRADGH
jgi:anaerobic selenocysteine-containing dehydrogenase